MIDPVECIDCGVCIPECPVEAIFDEATLPDDQRHFLALNAALAEVWPVISEQKDPPDDAEAWQRVAHKLQHLEGDPSPL